MFSSIPDLTDIVEKPRLIYDLQPLLIHTVRSCQLPCIVSHILRMTEGIVVFRVNGCRQRINSRRIIGIHPRLVGQLRRAFPAISFLVDDRPVFPGFLGIVDSRIRMFDQFMKIMDGADTQGDTAA